MGVYYINSYTYRICEYGLDFFTPQNCVNGYCWICEYGLDFFFFFFFFFNTAASVFEVLFCYKAQ